jgi:hypothetical protein
VGINAVFNVKAGFQQTRQTEHPTHPAPPLRQDRDDVFNDRRLFEVSGMTSIPQLKPADQQVVR